MSICDMAIAFAAGVWGPVWISGAVWLAELRQRQRRRGEEAWL